MCVGTVGSCESGLPGASLSLGTGIPAAAREAMGHRDFAAASEGCSGVTLWKWGRRDRREVSGFPRFSDSGGSPGREVEQVAAGCSPVPGLSRRRRDPGTSPSPPAAADGRRLQDPRVLRELEPLRVAPPGRSGIS